MVRRRWRSVRSIRRRWLVFGALATVLLALGSAGLALWIGARQIGPLPATALAPPARF